MSDVPFRLIHAADLHLDQPLGGLAEIPAHLRDLCVEAPRMAAARMFESARQQRAEVIVLAGDVIDPSVCGLAALRWLNDEFERAAAASIRVLWAGGKVDSAARWPRGWKLPANVHRFEGGPPQIVTHESRSGHRLEFIGSGTPLDRGAALSRWAAKTHGEPRVLIAHGNVARGKMADTGRDYWALGGRHQPLRKQIGSTLWRYAGTTQARATCEASPHGATLVELNRAGHFSMQAITCDAVRYRVEQVSVPIDSDAAHLESILHGRLEPIAKEATGLSVLVWWRLSGECRAMLRDDKKARQLLASLRQASGSREPPVWSVRLDWEPAPLVAGVSGDGTATDDFLRELSAWNALESPTAADAALASHAATRPPAWLRDGFRRAWKSWKEPDARQRLMAHAAHLGRELIEREPVA